MLTIISLCVALYASDISQTPYSTTCVSYSSPKRYDPKTCPGEVTTDKRGTAATCEIVVPRP